MDELAARAGVSRATLYRLVPGKEALFAELVRRFSPFEPIAAVLETMGDRPPAEVIPAVAQAMAAAMDGHIGLLLQLLLEVSAAIPTATPVPTPSGMRPRRCAPCRWSRTTWTSRWRPGACAGWTRSWRCRP